VLVWLLVHGGVSLRLIFLMFTLLGGGIVEIGRGVQGMHSLPPPPADAEFPKAIVVSHKAR
jgi:hypothetical protein